MRFVLWGLLLCPLLAWGESHLKFEYAEGLIWLQAKHTRSGRILNLVLDTGAQKSVLDLSTAREIGAPRGNPVLASGVGGNSTGYWPISCNLAIQQTPLPQNYLGLDLSEFSRACGRKVDGLIGADFFQKRIVEINYREQCIAFLQKAPESTEMLRLPIKKTTGGFLVNAQVTGSSEWFRVDTGSVSSHFVPLRPDLFPQREKRVTIGLASTSLESVKTTWKLGDTSIPDVETVLHKTPIFRGEHGLIGNNLLSRFTLVLDGPGKMLYLKKSAVE